MQKTEGIITVGDLIVALERVDPDLLARVGGSDSPLVLSVDGGEATILPSDLDDDLDLDGDDEDEDGCRAEDEDGEDDGLRHVYGCRTCRV